METTTTDPSPVQSSQSRQPSSNPDAQQQPVSGRQPAPARKRSSSGAGGLLSKLPFIRSSGEHRPRSRRNTNESDLTPAAQTQFPPIPSFTTLPADQSPRHTSATIPTSTVTQPPTPHLLPLSALQLPLKQRRRRGSLRKAALLGRGVQRARREARDLTIDTKIQVTGDGMPIEIHVGSVPSKAPDATSSNSNSPHRSIPVVKTEDHDSPSLGLGISEFTPRPGVDGYSSLRSSTPTSDPDMTPIAATAPNPRTSTPNITTTSYTIPGSSSPTIGYSTTDDEDSLHIQRPRSIPLPSITRQTTPSLSSASTTSLLLRPERASVSSISGSESYFRHRPLGTSSPAPGSPNPANGSGAAGAGTATTNMLTPSLDVRRRQKQRAKSPLALMSTASGLPPQDVGWDYSETEWWGWIILIVTWTVFVIGMGSCLGVWSWAWDVGTTPYAPPELEDDPTLPIVGYYPALMILTGVMAWVWVVVAWVGMKYFRHAQVSGD